jgi:hypothetical protein
MGLTGATGPQGLKGDTGAIGPTGPQRVVIPEPTDDDLDFAMDLIEEAAAAMIEE